MHAGASGTKTFADEPYGYIIGIASYFFYNHAINVKGGANETIKMVTPTVIALLIAAIVAFMMALREYLVRRLRKRGEGDVDVFTHKRSRKRRR